MGIFDIEDDYLDEGWADEDWRSGTQDAVAGMRLVLSDEYAHATDAEMEEALADVMDAMSPTEAFNFGSALNQIGRGAGQVFSDPTFASIARTALPIAGGALGTVIGGPVGTALGSQLGTIAANALPPPPAARPPGRPSVPGPGVVLPGLPVAPAPAAAHPQPGVPGAPPGAAGSPVVGGSTAAAQGLVLAGHPMLKRALASAAFGQHGQQQVAGISVAQLLGMLSQVMGQAAADADELLYLSGGPSQVATEDWQGEGEGDSEGWSSGGDLGLYTSIIDADDLEFAETIDLGSMAPSSTSRTGRGGGPARADPAGSDGLRSRLIQQVVLRWAESAEQRPTVVPGKAQTDDRASLVDLVVRAGANEEPRDYVPDDLSAEPDAEVAPDPADVQVLLASALGACDCSGLRQRCPACQGVGFPGCGGPRRGPFPGVHRPGRGAPQRSLGWRA